MTKPIIIHRYLWGQLKRRVGLIKLRGWRDEPFWKAWRLAQAEEHTKHYFCMGSAMRELAQQGPDDSFNNDLIVRENV